MTGWVRWSTGNCASNWNLTQQTNGIFTTLNPSRKMRHTNFSGILRYKLITLYQPDDQIEWSSTTKKKKISQKKTTCQIVDFVVPTDHWVKLKKSEKIDKYLEPKKLWNIKLKVFSIVIGALCGLVLWLEDLRIRRRKETFQTTTFVRSAWILRRVKEIWGDLMSLRLQWETIT